MSDSILRFAFVGDVSLGAASMRYGDIPEFPGWPAISAAIGPRDFFVGNLECCLVDERCSERACKQPMAVSAKAVAFLHATGFTDLSLANNHMLDCGSQAIEVTRERLTGVGIRMFGAGRNLRQAEEIVFAKRGTYTIALLGACDESEYYASGERQSGIAPLKKSRLGQRVRAAAAEADLVVVTLHADLEFCEVPGKWRQRLSRWLVKQGANLVIQHHPHVLQGIEMYRGGLIAYSLGNFIFGLRGNRYQENETGVFDSLVLVVDADMSGSSPKLDYRIVPVRIGDDHLPCCLTGLSREHAEHHFQELSSLTADPRKHRGVWFQRCRAEAVRRVFSIYYAIRRGNFKQAGREFSWLVARPEDRRWILGVVSLGLL